MQKHISHVGQNNLQVNYAEQMNYTLSHLLYTYYSMWMKAEQKQLFEIIVNLLLSLTVCNRVFFMIPI